MILTCVNCRKLHGKTCQQKMSDLLEEQLIEQPPFSYCGVDMFGPFLVKESRKIHKHYGAMFTYLCSRAAHIETTNSMTTTALFKNSRDSSVGEKILGLSKVTTVVTSLEQALS